MTTVTLTGDVIVLATPFDGALQCVADQAGDLAGKVVVDITNPVDWGSFDRLVTPADSSAGEEIAGRLGEGARVVKAFNTTFAGTLVAGEVAGQPLDVFVAADDEGRQAAGLRARGDRRHAGAGRRSVAVSPPARAPRVPAHGAPGPARHRGLEWPDAAPGF